MAALYGFGVVELCVQRKSGAPSVNPLPQRVDGTSFVGVEFVELYRQE